MRRPITSLHELFSFVQTRLFRRFHPYSKSAKTCIRANGDACFARSIFQLRRELVGKGEATVFFPMMVRFCRSSLPALAASDEKLKRASRNRPMGQLTYTAVA
jgi:hypothetical protein